MHANGTKLQVMDRPPAFGPDTQGRVFYVLQRLVIKFLRCGSATVWAVGSEGMS